MQNSDLPLKRVVYCRLRYDGLKKEHQLKLFTNMNRFPFWWSYLLKKKVEGLTPLSFLFPISSYPYLFQQKALEHCIGALELLVQYEEELFC